jgi:hypothetical protein
MERWGDRKGISMEAILFMKVGPHSGFDLSEIIAMKEAEEKAHGKFFWGYAGTLCHPYKVVDFARQSLKNGKRPMMVMAYTPSKYVSSIGRLSEYSVDKVRWVPLPEGVILKGCKYAVIGKGLRRVRFLIDLNSYTVWNGGQIALWGRSGKPLGEYLRGQVNKACAIFMPTSSKPPCYTQILCTAEIIEPYCVFLR